VKHLFLTLLLAGVTGCTRHDSATAAAPDFPAVTVRLADVQVADVPQFTDVSGTVHPVRRAVLAARVMGAITELPIALGQSVEAGALLVRIHATDAEARLAQARSVLSLARRDLERERALQSKGASTIETVRSLEDRLTGAEAAVREAEASLGYAEIHAPFAGVIARRLVNAGDFASPGQPLLEIEEITHFEVEASLPASLTTALRVGAPVTFETDGRPITGTLREIASAADPATRSVVVKIDIPAGAGVRSGQYVRIQVPGAARPTVLAPASAITLQGQMERVFLMGDGNRATLRLVRTGARRGDRIEILSGLSGDERLVVDPPATLRDNQPLRAQP
jgi:RND family efflux transporter MFP subunit